MTRRAIRAVVTLALAGMLAAPSAALADHKGDHHEHGHGNWQHHYVHHGDWHRHGYHDGYVHYYDYRPGYYGPQVYVPEPSPPSFGLNLVFPIH